MISQFNVTLFWPLPELPESAWLWFAKFTGAIAGSAISLAYVLPKGRREAAIRFLTGVMIGIIFGPAAGAKLVDQLGLSKALSGFEIALTGSAIASLAAWWALGVARRFFESRFASKKP